MARLVETAFHRAMTFCDEYGLQAPILMAPMAGACPPALAAAVANAGGMGACGALLMDAAKIDDWAKTFRASSNGSFQLNLWIPDPEPTRDAAHENAVVDFVAQWDRPESILTASPAVSFEDQCAALIAARPHVISSIMGLYPPDVVDQMKTNGIKWFATATNVAAARQAVEAGADAIIAQGSEAGGHQGAFDADAAHSQSCGLMALLPAICDAVDVPVIATGGIADARGVVAALTLGASAVQIGTALLRTPEAGIPTAWADAIAAAGPHETRLTRAFSGRLGRAVNTQYVAAAAADGAPNPLPYPLQRAATAAMRARGAKDNDLDRLQAWSGQSGHLARALPAAQIVSTLWEEAQHAIGR